MAGKKNWMALTLIQNSLAAFWGVGSVTGMQIKWMTFQF